MHQNKKDFKLSLFALLLITNLNAQESNEAINLQKVVVSATGFEQDADSKFTQCNQHRRQRSAK